MRPSGRRTRTRLYNRVRYHFHGSKGVRHDTAKQIMLAANAHGFRRIESDKGIARHEVFWPGVTRGRLTVRCNFVADERRKLHGVLMVPRSHAPARNFLRTGQVIDNEAARSSARIGGAIRLNTAKGISVLVHMLCRTG